MPIVKCPTCSKKIEYSNNKFRPFCTERCKLLDFGEWAEENFRFPAETSSLTESDIDQLEKVRTRKKAR